MRKSLIPFFRKGTILSLAVMLSSCAVVRTEVPELPESDIPPVWVSPTDPDAAVWPELDWWNNFESEELTQIIELVKENNLSLENNERTLENAQSQLRDAGLNLLPIPTVGVSTGTTFTDGPTGSNTNNRDISISASTSYNNILTIPDIYENAQVTYESAVASHASTILTTMVQTANAYFSILNNRDQMQATRLNLENTEQLLNIAEVRLEAGVITPLEVLSQRQTLLQQQNSLRTQEQTDLSLRAQLAILMGMSVYEVSVEGETLADLSVPAVQPGIPSELLRRVPSLVQAENNLRRSAISVDQVYLNLFPQISLTGSVNASSSSLLDIITFPDEIISLSATLAQTLLDDGRRYRNLERSRNSLESQLNSYRQTVIQAFNDVEVQLNNIQVIELSLESANLQLEIAEESFRQAELEYQEGTGSFENLIRQQNSLFNARNSYLNTRRSQLSAIVNMYQALGGGWEMPETGSE